MANCSLAQETDTSPRLLRAIAPSAALDVGGGGGAEGDVIAAGPVVEIMKTFLIWAAVVADFVGAESSDGEARAGGAKHFYFDFGFDDEADLAEPAADRERGVGLVGQAVAGEMICIQCDRLLEGVHPERECLTGDCVDEVEI